MADSLKLSDSERAFHHRYGGVALGLRLLGEASALIEGLDAPSWVALNIEGLRRGGPPPGSSEARQLAALDGRHVALKFSGARESFSAHVSRGVNSSSRGPGPFVSNREGAIPAASEAASTAPDGTCAIILQEMATGDSPFEYITVHASDDRVLIEARDDHDVLILESTQCGSWLETRGGATPSQDIHSEFETIAAMHRRLVALLGFEVNTEGFRRGDEFTAIQLRPVPHDLPTDPSLTAKVWHAAAQPGAFVTHFVYGTYDLRGVVSRWPDAGDSVGLFHEPPRLATLSDLEPYVRSVDLRTLEAKWPLGTAVWLSAANVGAETNEAAFLALDTLDAFHLSHDVAHLPPVGRFRDHLRYAACLPLLEVLGDGSEVEAISDGNYAAIRWLA